MKRIFIFLIVFAFVTTNFVFSQSRSYYSVYYSNQNEIHLRVLCLNDNNTYLYYSLFCNSEGAWSRIDSSRGVWSAICRHKMELKTYQYIKADNETKKLLCVLSGSDPMTFSYITVKLYKHYLINKEYSNKPMVSWKRLSLEKQDRNRIKEYLINTMKFSTDLF